MISLNNPDPLIKLWNEQGTYHLDVHDLLIQGGEPYPHIMECLGQLARGETLILHTPFEPKPLAAHVEKMAMQARSQRVGSDLWETIITFEKQE